MRITVAFFTYTPTMESPRHAYAMRSLQSLVDKLTYSEGHLAWHVADDGSPPEHLQALMDGPLLKAREHYQQTTSSNTAHNGYGASYNAMTQAVHPAADAVLCVEDDWELMRPFDLSDLARALDANIVEADEIDCIRLGYLGWTNPLQGKLVQVAGQTFLRFDPESVELHVFAGHPRLETVEFERRLGPWPEGIKAGYTEIMVSQRPASREGVAWPLDAGVNASQDFCNLFAHIGEEQA